MTARVCDCGGGGSRSRSVAITTVEQRLSQRHERNATNWAPTVSSSSRQQRQQRQRRQRWQQRRRCRALLRRAQLLRLTFGTRLTFGRTANVLLGLLCLLSYAETRSLSRHTRCALSFCTRHVLSVGTRRTVGQQRDLVDLLNKMCI